MTDADAIALLDSKISETDSEISSVNSAYSEFDTAKDDLGVAVNGVSSRLISMDDTVNYFLDNYVDTLL